MIVDHWVSQVLELLAPGLRDRSGRCMDCRTLHEHTLGAVWHFSGHCPVREYIDGRKRVHTRERLDAWIYSDAVAVECGACKLDPEARDRVARYFLPYLNGRGLTVCGKRYVEPGAGPREAETWSPTAPSPEFAHDGKAA